MLNPQNEMSSMCYHASQVGGINVLSRILQMNAILFRIFDIKMQEFT